LALHRPGEIEADAIAGMDSANRIAELLADQGLITIDAEEP